MILKTSGYCYFMKLNVAEQTMVHNPDGLRRLEVGRYRRIGCNLLHFNSRVKALTKVHSIYDNASYKNVLLLFLLINL